MTLFAYTIDILAWWRWEARGLTRSWRSDAAPSLSLHLHRHVLRIEERRSGRSVEIGRIADGEDLVARLREILRAPRRRRRPATVVVEPDRYLKRSLSPLRLPRSRLRAMASLDAAGLPLAAGECHMVLPEYRATRAESAYYVVRRGHLDPVLAALRGAGLGTAGVALADEGGLIRPDRASLERICPPPVRARLARWLTLSAGAVALAGLLALAGAAHWRYAAALATLETEIAAAAAEAAVARRAIEARNRKMAEIAALRTAKSEAVPLTRVLEELARLLPDSTALEGLDYREAAMTFSGTSAAAAALIPALDASALFHAPTFSQPVVFEAGRGERFTIALEVERENG